jgi:hypothetical protein
LLYEDKEGAKMLHGWQIAGEWDKRPPPAWMNLRLVDISEVDVLGDTYSAPQQGYAPDSARFHRVLVATPVGP